MYYKVRNYVRYTLCGSCDKGIEWEHDGEYSLCYCTYDTYISLIKQLLKTKIRRKSNESIF